MPLIFEQKIAEASLLVWNANEEIAYFEEQLPLTVANDQEYSKRKSNKRKLEFLVPRLLIKQRLKEEKRVYYTPLGQPYLDNCPISISHSGPFIALIIGQCSQTVAIDIEQSSSKVSRVVDKFLLPEEHSVLSTDPVRYYTLCWSAKETLFKFSPRPSVDFRKHLHLSPFILSDTGTILAHQSHNPSTTQMLSIHFFTFPEWVLTALVE